MINRVFADRFTVEDKLGNGAYGEVYKVLNTNDKKKYAAKFEDIRSNHQELYAEYKILQRLGKDPLLLGIPRPHFYGVHQEKNMLVVDLLGENLSKKLQECEGKFTLKTVVMIADQVIKRLEFIHDRRIIHRDVMPSNFVVGLGTQGQTIFLIDFGKAKKFKDSRGKHIDLKENKLPVGNLRYTSLWADKGMEQSRRDDLESMVFMLIYFLKGTLPWSGIQAKTICEKFRAIRNAKAKISISELCQEMPHEIGELLQYIRSLKFEEDPNYTTIKSILKKIIASHNYLMDFVYDWKMYKLTNLTNKKKPQPDKKPSPDKKPVNPPQPPAKA